jgi:hypothetical protein
MHILWACTYLVALPFWATDGARVSSNRLGAFAGLQRSVIIVIISFDSTVGVILIPHGYSWRSVFRTKTE